MADLRGDRRGITDSGESDPLFLWNDASDVVRRFHDGGDYRNPSSFFPSTASAVFGYLLASSRPHAIANCMFC